MGYLTLFFKGIEDLLFPRVCQVCGNPVAENEFSVCMLCVETRFDRADSDLLRWERGEFLPECLAAHHALWIFDKGGYLQDVLHSLKYHGNSGAGVDMGRALGRSMADDPVFNIDPEDCILIPVPLHPARKRKRGYNQSELIAEGVSEVTGIPLVSETAVRRIKNTRTQTGFDLNKRRDNISEVFSVERPQELESKICILIDDVYTTGATLFELASVIEQADPAQILSATVAQA